MHLKTGSVDERVGSSDGSVGVHLIKRVRNCWSLDREPSDVSTSMY